MRLFYPMRTKAPHTREEGVSSMRLLLSYYEHSLAYSSLSLLRIGKQLYEPSY